MTPVYDPEIRKELWDILQIQLSDNCKARISGTDFTNEYKKTESKKMIRAQFETYSYFKKKIDWQSDKDSNKLSD